MNKNRRSRGRREIKGVTASTAKPPIARRETGVFANALGHVTLPLGGFVAALLAMRCVSPALAKTAVSCGGAALLGGVELLCSHVDPTAPAQICTFSWALATPANLTQVVEGSFLIPPGSANVIEYQGSGFVRALSEPIVLCQGKRSGR